MLKGKSDGIQDKRNVQKVSNIVGPDLSCLNSQSVTAQLDGFRSEMSSG
jgi:hypothetical protein